MTEPALHLFGVIHVDRPSKVRAELAEYAADLDAVFLERPAEELTPKTYLRGLAFAPGVVLGALFYGLLFLPFHALIVREALALEWIAAEDLAQERDVAVHHVDDHPLWTVATGGWPFRIVGWIGLLVPVALFPVATATTVGVLVGLFAASSVAYRIDRRLWIAVAVPLWIGGAIAGWFGLVSPYALGPFVLSFLATTMGTLGGRNRVMLDRAREISEAEGYDDGVLVTGKAHLGGMVEMADDVGVGIARVHVSKLFRRSDRTYEGVDDGVMAFGVEPAMDTAGEVWRDRVFAALVDLAIAFLVVVPLLTVSVYAVVSVLVVGGVAMFVVTLLLTLFFGPVLYHLRFEGRVGRTPGKRRMGLVVVRTDGSRMSRPRALARNVFRPLDVFTGYLVGGVVSAVTDRGQKPTDFLADTVVVKAERARTRGSTTTPTTTAKVDEAT